jgi:hypothetical protein
MKNQFDASCTIVEFSRLSHWRSVLCTIRKFYMFVGHQQLLLVTITLSSWTVALLVLFRIRMLLWIRSANFAAKDLLIHLFRFHSKNQLDRWWWLAMVDDCADLTLLCTKTDRLCWQMKLLRFAIDLSIDLSSLF